jgi:hypothetical protein
VTLGVTRRGSRGDGAKLLHAQCKVEIAIVMVLSGVVVKESVVSKVAVMVLSEEFVKESVVSKGTTTNVTAIKVARLPIRPVVGYGLIGIVEPVLIVAVKVAGARRVHKGGHGRERCRCRRARFLTVSSVTITVNERGLVASVIVK